MCSFLLSTKPVNDTKNVNRLLQLRGPDLTNVEVINGITFLHNLLSITGAWTPQPLVSNDIVVLFNGEIYGVDEYDNDSKCLIPLYKQYGEEFTKKLDGEFSIVLIDFTKCKIIASVDIFKTKPLFYAVNDREFGAASYADPLHKLGFVDIKKFKANTTMVFDLKTKKILNTFSNYEFDLKQHKPHYEDWNVAFTRSIEKRAKINVREKIFIGISSGYDSGSVACEMNALGLPFKGYTNLGAENHKVLADRYEILKKLSILEQYTANDRQLAQAHAFIEVNTDPYFYTIHSTRSSYNEYNLKLIDDNGSNQFSYLCSKAKKDGFKIHMSGAGADELFSDYGFNGNSKYPHSNFGGLFPKDLTTIFPWASFYESSMESYLAKEEYVGGAYGIESRYPFLDKQVVQEFLWITQKLKNIQYKNVLHNYLETHSFPFSVGEKIGF